MAAPVGFEPTHVGTKIRCLSAWRRGKMVEGEGFEPPNSKEVGYSHPRLAASLPLQFICVINYIINILNSFYKKSAFKKIRIYFLILVFKHMVEMRGVEPRSKKWVILFIYSLVYSLIHFCFIRTNKKIKRKPIQNSLSFNRIHLHTL